MYIIVFKAWNGTRCETHYNEKDAKKRYLNLKEIYAEVSLLKVEEIVM